MSVVTAKNADGDMAVGIKVEGAFIPLATIPAHRIEHAVERHKTLSERAGANDEEAQKVLDADFQVEGSAGAKRQEKEAAE